MCWGPICSSPFLLTEGIDQDKNNGKLNSYRGKHILGKINDTEDDAFARGQGLDWIPDNCNECSTVRRIFEQTVTYREWQEPLMYADDEPHTMWDWNPLPHHKHCV